MKRWLIAGALSLISASCIAILVLSGLINFQSFLEKLVAGLMASILLAVWVWVIKPFLDKSGKNPKVPQEVEIKQAVVDLKIQVPEPPNNSQTLIKTEEKKEVTNSSWLPDLDHPGRVTISNNTIDEFFDYAQVLAIEEYADAKLEDFTMQIYPYKSLNGIRSAVRLYFDFYSKWKDMIVSVALDENKGASTSNKEVFSDYERVVLDALPWKECPRWGGFIRMAYEKVEPLSINEETFFHLMVSKIDKNFKFSLMIHDGYKNKTNIAYWTGKEIDANNIVFTR